MEFWSRGEGGGRYPDDEHSGGRSKGQGAAGGARTLSPNKTLSLVLSASISLQGEAFQQELSKTDETAILEFSSPFPSYCYRTHRVSITGTPI